MAGDEVDEDAALGAERGGEGDARREALGRPREYLGGGSALKGVDGGGDVHCALQTLVSSNLRPCGRAPRRRQRGGARNQKARAFVPGGLSVVCVRG